MENRIWKSKSKGSSKRKKSVPVEEQNKLWLYGSDRCPYCNHVQRFLGDIGESVELRDTGTNRDNLMELVRATGRQTVPCLKIEEPEGDVRWLHESVDIIEFLKDHFGGTDSTA